eukprot:CAMPEP_0172447424 /NCGR_PEP_ID=MMETSP1065-20121228/6748_1 /TAXON_ID=265537 /ORGANISM="Amphiprora paludosa, Strain CCMP125" /LENGTH=128 /DNA_ID=CAMNT_0013198727 /DNA_START=110 /DNA_END=493 /DNA_ORIENTATION=-
MTDISQTTNIAYAWKHRVDFARMNGVAYGSRKGADATYNKPYILKTVLDANLAAAKSKKKKSNTASKKGTSSTMMYDAVLVLDSDALIVDLDFDALELLPETYLLAAEKASVVDTNSTWDINAGVTLW